MSEGTEFRTSLIKLHSLQRSPGGTPCGLKSHGLGHGERGEAHLQNCKTKIFAIREPPYTHLSEFSILGV